ncbi:MAG: hypothetical protein RLZZ618_3422 [Pseudomonadota bacterium]
MLRRMRLFDPLRPAALAVAAVFCVAAHAAPDSDQISWFAQDAPNFGKPVPASKAEAQPGFIRQMGNSASAMVVSSMNFLGVRYRRGGNSAEEGFDCSGFTRHVFENSLGLILPRRADEQATAPGLKKVQKDELQPGDLVFFNTLKRTFSHVGIYVGEGKFIHAPRSGSVVRVEDMRFAYWSKRFTGARRADVDSPNTAAAAAVPAVTPPATATPGNTTAARSAMPSPAVDPFVPFP